MIRHAIVLGVALALSGCTGMGFNGPNQPTTLDLLKEINTHCTFDGQMGAGVGGFAGTATGASLTGSMHCEPTAAITPQPTH